MYWRNLNFGPGAQWKVLCVGEKGFARCFDNEGSEPLDGLAVNQADHSDACIGEIRNGHILWVVSRLGTSSL